MNGRILTKAEIERLVRSVRVSQLGKKVGPVVSSHEVLRARIIEARHRIKALPTLDNPPQMIECLEDVDAILGCVPTEDTPARSGAAIFDLVAHLERQRAFSARAFGPGERTAGVVDHIRKELDEILQRPHDVSEWIDVVLLALDGAWRAGYTSQQVADAIAAKQAKNESRTWPDWRLAPEGKAIEHIRESDDAGTNQ